MGLTQHIHNISLAQLGSLALLNRDNLLCTLLCFSWLFNVGFSREGREGTHCWALLCVSFLRHVCFRRHVAARTSVTSPSCSPRPSGALLLRLLHPSWTSQLRLLYPSIPVSFRLKAKREFAVVASHVLACLLARWFALSAARWHNIIWLRCSPGWPKLDHVEVVGVILRCTSPVADKAEVHGIVA